MTKRFTKKKILKVLKEKEDGARIKDLCAKHGMSSAALYRWKAKYSGMNLDVGDAGHQGDKKKMGKPKKQAVTASPKMMPQDKSTDKPATSFWASVRGFFS
ncbi:MAG: transposase [Candidatus Puniceispirillales bacterium WSBS_2018_MAG_OTU23]